MLIRCSKHSHTRMSPAYQTACLLLRSFIWPEPPTSKKRSTISWSLLSLLVSTKSRNITIRLHLLMHILWLWVIFMLVLPAYCSWTHIYTSSWSEHQDSSFQERLGPEPWAICSRRSWGNCEYHLLFNHAFYWNSQFQQFQKCWEKIHSDLSALNAPSLALATSRSHLDDEKSNDKESPSVNIPPSSKKP